MKQFRIYLFLYIYKLYLFNSQRYPQLKVHDSLKYDEHEKREEIEKTGEARTLERFNFV